jgi:hypothetical protein
MRRLFVIVLGRDDEKVETNFKRRTKMEEEWGCGRVGGVKNTPKVLDFTTSACNGNHGSRPSWKSPIHLFMPRFF